MESLDKLFTMVFLCSPVIIGLVISFGVDPRLVYFNGLLFLVWAIYIYGYRGVYQLQEQRELSFIERARGVSYVFSFIVTFILNGFLVFYPSTVNSLVVIVLVGVSLTAVVAIIPKAFFSKQVTLFKKEQKIMFYKVLSLTGSVSIYYSMTVAMLGSLIYQKLGSLIDILGLAVFSMPLVFIYQRERKSRELAGNLANSLKDTSWMQCCLRQKKIELRKQRKKKARSP
jgi:hypothetical protein